MKNFAGGRGETFPFTSQAKSAGDGVLQGAIFGVSLNTYLSSETGQMILVGVFTLPKTTSEAWTLGQALYWDDSTKKLTTTAGSLKRAGVAYAAAGSADTTGPCDLNVGY